MSNQEIQDRLRRQGDNWLERQRAEAAMAKEKSDRRQRNVEALYAFLKLAGGALLGLAILYVIKIMVEVAR